MAWDDFGFDSGGSDWDFGGLDTGSYSPMDYSNFQMPQAPMMDNTQMGQGMQYDPISNSYANSAGGQVPGQTQQPQQGNWFTNMLPTALGGTGGGWGVTTQNAPSGGGGGAGQSGGGSLLPGLLGLGGGLAGLAGVLAGGGQGASQQRTVTNAGQGSMDSANSGNAIAAQGQLPVQQMQMSLLQALQSGQGLPLGYQQLIEQAYQPQMGDLVTQATNAGRSRGFHDAPMQSPPGGAIMGPGLSNIQGQMAKSKLDMMQQMPGVFQNPINSQIGAQGNASQGLMNSAGMTAGQQGSQPMGPQIGNIIGSGLQGWGQSITQSNQQQQQQANFDKMIARPDAYRYFGSGGIVTKPTNAIIGEAGPEAVVPLSGGKEGDLMKIIMQLLMHQMGSRATGGDKR